MTIIARRSPTAGCGRWWKRMRGGTPAANPSSVMGINCHDNLFSAETLVGVSGVAFAVGAGDAGPQSSSDSTTGIGLYQDHPTQGIQGVFDAADIVIPLNPPEYELNYFADHPGADGVLGTYDDPGMLGVTMASTRYFWTMGTFRWCGTFRTRWWTTERTPDRHGVGQTTLHVCRIRRGSIFSGRSFWWLRKTWICRRTIMATMKDRISFVRRGRVRRSAIGIRTCSVWARNGVYYSSGRAINDSDVITRKITTNVPIASGGRGPGRRPGRRTRKCR